MSRFGLLASVSALVFAANIADARAASVTFAQFTQQVTTQTTDTGVVFGSNTLGGVLATTGGSAGLPVFFSFTGVTGLPSDLLTQQAATLTFNSGGGAVTTAGAVSVNIPGSGNLLIQPFNLSYEVEFTRASPYIYNGVNYGTNLLTVDVSPANGNASAIVAAPNSRSGTLSFSSANESVTFSSGFLSFPKGSTVDGSLGLSNVLPAFSINPATGFLNNFIGDAVGTFDADPPPFGSIIPLSVPEPAPLAALGVAAGLLVWARRRSA